MYDQYWPLMLSSLAQTIYRNLKARGYLPDGISLKTIFDDLNQSAGEKIEKPEFEEACKELEREGLLEYYKPISQPFADFPLGAIKLKAQPGEIEAGRHDHPARHYKRSSCCDFINSDACDSHSQRGVFGMPAEACRRRDQDFASIAGVCYAWSMVVVGFLMALANCFSTSFGARYFLPLYSFVQIALMLLVALLTRDSHLVFGSTRLLRAR
jgi:hypothetical protein